MGWSFLTSTVENAFLCDFSTVKWYAAFAILMVVKEALAWAFIFDSDLA